MRKLIIFGWRRLTPPAFIGGAEITEGLWAALLASLGHEVWFIGSAENPRDHATSSLDWLLSVLAHDGITHSLSTSGIEYMWRDVKCVCVSQADVLSVIKAAIELRPALLWTSQEGCDEIADLATHTPIATYVHSISKVGMLSLGIKARFTLAPSIFMKETIYRHSGVQSILARPIIERTKTTEVTGKRNIVLFVNPIPEKGLSLALALAEAIPNYKFVFVEGWRNFDIDGKLVSSNITILERQRRLDYLYAQARILIVPSMIHDAAPRVILEAGEHGVPVLGSPLGGISELVANPRENCIPPFLIERWVARTRQLIDDDITWNIASCAQRNHTSRLVVNPNWALKETGILGVIS